MSESKPVVVVKNPPFQSHFNEYGKHMEYFKNQPPKVTLLDEKFIKTNFPSQFHEAILSADVSDQLVHLNPSRIINSYEGPNGDYIRHLQNQFWDKTKIVKLTEEEELLLREKMGPQFVLNHMSIHELKELGMKLVEDKRRLDEIYGQEMEMDVHEETDETSFVSRKLHAKANENETLSQQQTESQQTFMEE